MKIYNEEKTKELNINDLDFELGYLKNVKMVINHEAVEAIEEQGHYETIAEYPNGGKDVKWVVDIEGREAKDAYTESIDIQIFKMYTNEELQNKKNDEELMRLKQELADTDYQAIKYAEGYFTEEEYKSIKAYRESLREQIRKIIDKKE